MNQQRLRFFGTLVVCFLGFIAIGGSLGWTLHGHPTLAALTLSFVIVGGVLAWVKWR